MNPKDLKQRALNFFGTSPGIGFGSFGVPSFTRRVRITPRKNVPQSVVEKISKSYGASSEDSLASSASAINNLGRVALSLEQTKNNLDRIVEVIAEDYKISKDQNKKEADEYRKRIANRGRLFGKKELGDKKTDLGFSIGKYVSSFFSKDGILGGLAALSTLKLIEALLSGDLSKVIGPLMALASVVIVPKIIGLILKQIGKNVLGNLFRGGTAAGVGAAGAAAGAGRFAGLARFGGRAALLGGGLALGSQLFKSNQDSTQQRLEELTQQQKQSVAPENLVPTPQNDLKRFENLNKKFEEALDFLLKKQKEQGGPGRGGSGGPGGGPGGGAIPPRGSGPGSLVAGDSSLRGTVSGNRFSVEQVADLARKVGFNEQEAAFMAAVAMRESSGNPTIDTVKSGMDPQKINEYSIGLVQINWKVHQGWLKKMGITSPDQLRDPVTNLQAAYALYKIVGSFRPWSGAKSAKQSDVNKALRHLKSSPPPPRSLPAPAPVTYPSIGPSFDNPIVNYTVVPAQTSGSQSTAMPGIENNDVPAISTFYSGNFLTLYSKLMYQIV